LIELDTAAIALLAVTTAVFEFVRAVLAVEVAKFAAVTAELAAFTAVVAFDEAVDDVALAVFAVVTA
jgi:hypothetical protein